MSTEKTSSWVYTLKKEELIVELNQLGLDISGTTDELRKRLSDHIKGDKKQKKMNTDNTNTPVTTSSHAITTTSIVTTTSKTCTIASTPTTSNITPVISYNYTGVPAPPFICSQQYTMPSLALPSISGSPSVSPQIATSVKGIDCISDADVMDKVRKWNVKFDEGQEPLGFLERVEELAECYQIPTDRLLRALPELLHKNALMWYRNNRLNWSTWENFVEDFKTFFLPPRFECKLADDIRARVQKPGEKIKKYVTAIQSLMRWQQGCTPEERLQRIYENLLPEYRLYIRFRDFNSLADLVKLAEEYELIKEEERKMKPKHSLAEERKPVRAPNTAYPVKMPYSRDECCWRCGQRGHTKANCKNPSKLFCSRCGQMGILSRDCQCDRPRQQGNDRGVQGGSGDRVPHKTTP